HMLVHIRELLDVEAALACRMLAESCEQRRSLAKPDHAIQNGCGLTWRESNNRHIALPPTLVSVVVAAEANNGWPPHFGFSPAALCINLTNALASARLVGSGR